MNLARAVQGILEPYSHEFSIARYHRGLRSPVLMSNDCLTRYYRRSQSSVFMMIDDEDNNTISHNGMSMPAISVEFHKYWITFFPHFTAVPNVVPTINYNFPAYKIDLCRLSFPTCVTSLIVSMMSQDIAEIQLDVRLNFSSLNKGLISCNMTNHWRARNDLCFRHLTRNIFHFFSCYDSEYGTIRMKWKDLNKYPVQSHEIICTRHPSAISASLSHIWHIFHGWMCIKY